MKDTTDSREIKGEEKVVYRFEKAFNGDGPKFMEEIVNTSIDDGWDFVQAYPHNGGLVFMFSKKEGK